MSEILDKESRRLQNQKYQNQQQKPAQYYRDNRCRGILALIGIFLLNFSLGEWGLLSQLYPYFSTYFHYNGKNFDPENMKYLSIAYLFTSTISLQLANFIYRFAGYKASFLIFVAMFAASQYACAYITDFWTFVAVLSAGGGLASGGYLIQVYCVWRYFSPELRPLINGLIYSAAGLAPILSSFIALEVINPEDSKADINGLFPASVAKNVPFYFKFFAGFVAVSGIVGVLLITEPVKPGLETPDLDQKGTTLTEAKRSTTSRYSRADTIQLVDPKTIIESEGTETSNDSRTRQRGNSSQKSKRERLRKSITNLSKRPSFNYKRAEIKPVDCSDFKIFSDKRFLALLIVTFFAWFYPLFFVYNFKFIALSHGLKDSLITEAGYVSSIVNAASRIVVSLIYQVFGYRVVYFSMIFIQFTSSASFVFSLVRPAAFFFELPYFYVSYGGLLASNPLICYELFGSEGVFANTNLYLANTVTNLIVLWVGDNLLDKVGVQVVIWILGGVALVSLLPAWWIGGQVKKENEKEEIAGLMTTTATLANTTTADQKDLYARIYDTDDKE